MTDRHHRTERPEPDPELRDALLDEVPAARGDFWARMDESLEEISEGGETAREVVRLTSMNNSSRPNPLHRLLAAAASIVLVAVVAVFAVNALGDEEGSVGPANEVPSSTSDDTVSSTSTSADVSITSAAGAASTTAVPLTSPTSTTVGTDTAPVATSQLLDTFGTGGPFAVDQFNEPTTGPNGSGCAPGPGDLPDGVWFGALRSTNDDDPLTVNFDLMCEYAGENAPVEDFEFDDYVQNESDAERAVPVAEDATLWVGYCFDSSLASTGGVNPPLQAVDRLPELNNEDGFFSPVFEVSVWLLVVDGEITEILDGWYSCAG